MHAFNMRVFFYKSFGICPPLNRDFFRYRTTKCLFELNTNMPGKAKYLVANRFLESIHERKSYHHYCNAYNRGSDGKPDNKPGKRILTVKCYSICYKACNVQGVKFVYQK